MGSMKSANAPPKPYILSPNHDRIYLKVCYHPARGGSSIRNIHQYIRFLSITKEVLDLAPGKTYLQKDLSQMRTGLSDYQRHENLLQL